MCHPGSEPIPDAERQLPCCVGDEGMCHGAGKEPGREHGLQATPGLGVQGQAAVETQSAHSRSPRAVATRRGVPQRPGVWGASSQETALCPRGRPPRWREAPRSSPPGLCPRSLQPEPSPQTTVSGTALNTSPVFSTIFIVTLRAGNYRHEETKAQRDQDSNPRSQALQSTNLTCTNLGLMEP